jgi:hypothetical protein
MTQRQIIVRSCPHKNRPSCHCDGDTPIVRCPSNTKPDCSIRDTRSKFRKDTGYNPSWAQIKHMLGED